MTLKKKIGEEEHHPCDLRLDEQDLKNALSCWAMSQGYVVDQREEMHLNIAVDDDAIVDGDDRTVGATIPILPPGHSHYDKLGGPEIRKSETGEVGARLWIGLHVHSHGTDVVPLSQDNSEAEFTEILRARGDWTEEDDNRDGTYVEIRGPFFLNLNIVDLTLAAVERNAGRIEAEEKKAP